MTQVDETWLPQSQYVQMFSLGDAACPEVGLLSSACRWTKVALSVIVLTPRSLYTVETGTLSMTMCWAAARVISMYPATSRLGSVQILNHPGPFLSSAGAGKLMPCCFGLASRNSLECHFFASAAVILFLSITVKPSAQAP